MKQTIERKVREGYLFDLPKYYTEGWAIFTKKPLPFIEFVVITAIIGLVQSYIPLGGYINGFLITPALGVGYYTAADIIKSNGNLKFAHFFDGFQYYIQLLVYTLLVALLLIVLIVALMVIGYLVIRPMITPYGNPSGIGTTIGIFTLISFVIMLYVFASFLYATHFIVFAGQDAVNAMASSRAIVGKNWLMILLMLLSFGVITIIAYAIVFFAISQFVVFPSFEEIKELTSSSIMMKFTELSKELTIGISIVSIIVTPVIHCVIHSSFRDIMDMDKGQEADTLSHFIEKQF